MGNKEKINVQFPQELPKNINISRYRPIPFYYITTRIPEELSYSEILRSLRFIRESGYGGVVLFNRQPSGFTEEQYLTDVWFEMVGRVLEAAEELGLRVWINDSFDAPPGNAGRRINKLAPHLSQKRLVLSDGKVTVEDRGVEDVYFPAYEEPESSKLFISLVYEEYKKRFEKYFGGVFAGFFSDSDCRRVDWSVTWPASPLKDYFPWSDCFADSFEEKYGYDIRPFLPSIIRREVISQAVDYWTHSGDLYFQWFENNYQWCQKNRLEYTYHTSDTGPNMISYETPYSSIFTQGAAPNAYMHCDYPGTDHEFLDLSGARLLTNTRTQRLGLVSWAGDDNWKTVPNFYDVWADLRAKQAQSAAFLYDRKGVMCEMYATTTWGATKKQLRNIASWQIMQGVTFIVPQAFHYRLRGDTKYFPPLNFSEYTLNLREFNDMLAQYACLADMGRLKVAMAVLDITEDVWRYGISSKDYNDVCFEMNRHPQGYIVSDMDGIIRKADRLRAVINPGLELGSRRKILTDLGLKIIDKHEIDRLDEFVPVDVSYSGEGTPHFMRRTLEDGSELVLVANIEGESSICGRVKTKYGCYDVELTSGEIAFFAKDFQLYHPLKKDAVRKIFLPQKTSVRWFEENTINLDRWEDADGRPASRLGEKRDYIFYEKGIIPEREFPLRTQKYCERLYFRFTTAENFPELRLNISERTMDDVRELTFDGVRLDSYHQRQIFDDRYRVYTLPGGALPGSHTLEVDRSAPLYFNDILFLAGEFDTDIEVENGFYDITDTPYMLIYMPEKASVILKKRRDELRTDVSWADQGHPFYSGQVKYRFEVEIPDNVGETVLTLPLVRDECAAALDGRALGVKLWQPYRYALGKISGKHVIELTITNSLANLIECHRAQSGLLAGGYIELFGEIHV